MHTRDCGQVAVVPVDDSRSRRPAAAPLPTANDNGMATYAHTCFEAILARALVAEDRPDGPRVDPARRSGSRGTIRSASLRQHPDGRWPFGPSATSAGHPRQRTFFLCLEAQRRASRHLLVLSAARDSSKMREVPDAVDWPMNPAVDMRFARIKLAQPIVIFPNLRSAQRHRWTRVGPTVVICRPRCSAGSAPTTQVSPPTSHVATRRPRRERNSRRRLPIPGHPASRSRRAIRRPPRRALAGRELLATLAVLTAFMRAVALRAPSPSAAKSDCGLGFRLYRVRARAHP